MDAGPDAARGEWTVRVLLTVAFVAVCLGPHLDRIRHPSLFADDVTRIMRLQTEPLSVLLFRPFQEHMAPLFEIVSWATWQAAGRRLSHAPLAFTVASYVPFIVVLGLLGGFVRKELASATTAAVAVAAYCLSSLHLETVYWYSASSFTWALLWTLVTLSCASTAARTNHPQPLLWASLAAAVAPAFSAIGLLAGPLGAIQIATSRDATHGRARFCGCGPLLGTLIYLALCGAFRYHHILGNSIEHRANFGSGLFYVLCAPTHVLLPGFLELRHLRTGPAPWLNLAIALLSVAGVFVWGWRSQRRGLILGALWLVLGGYAVTYCFRTQQFGTQGLFKVERYNLFPFLGFVIWLATALRPLLHRYDRRPVVGLAVATTISALLMVVHFPSIHTRSRGYDFPSQGLTLSSLERIDEISRREGITRGQVLAALDQIELRWSRGANLLGMLADSVETPAVPDSSVRRIILDALSSTDREAFWGGMDASCFLKPTSKSSKNGLSGRGGHLVGFSGVRREAEGRYVTTGWPSFLEFELPVEVDPVLPDPGGRAAIALCLPQEYAGCRMEIWWAGRDNFWSEGRSIVWQPEPEAANQDLAVPLDRLPHWDSHTVRRIRVMFRSRQSIAFAAPRLLQ
jgi:hypothetical protein